MVPAAKTVTIQVCGTTKTKVLVPANAVLEKSHLKERILLTNLDHGYLPISTNILKGTATLMRSMSYQKELNELRILIQVSSKSVEKWASYGHLKNQYGKHLAAILNI